MSGWGEAYTQEMLGWLSEDKRAELYLHLTPVFCFPHTKSSLNGVK